MPLSKVTASDILFLFEYIYEETGIVLTEEKKYLLETRLQPLVNEFALEHIGYIVKDLRMKGKSSLIHEPVINAITTNETLFFRDETPYKVLCNDVFPYLVEKNKASRKLRIWSAACSEGQEPYTIAMCLKEAKDLFLGWDYEIIATDISTNVLEKAERGVYSQFEVGRGVDEYYLNKYFTGENNKWSVNNDIRSVVKFQKANLLGNLGGLGSFDIIFCRNVLIYFDEQTKRKVVASLVRNMNPDAVLFTGSAEIAVNLSDKLTFFDKNNRVYKLKEEACENSFLEEARRIQERMAAESSDSQNS